MLRAYSHGARALHQGTALLAFRDNSWSALVSIPPKDPSVAFIWFSTLCPRAALVSVLPREHKSVTALSPLSPARISSCTGASGS